MNKPHVILLLVLIISIITAPIVLYSNSVNSTSRYRVVILSADAMRFDHLTKLASEGKLPNISRMMNNGVYAELVTVYPTATAVAHAAISTGAPPGVNGITGNSIHLPNTPVTSTVSGFSGLYMVSEPIWITADKAGLKAVVVSFPQSTPPAWNVSRALLFNIYDASAAFTSSALYTTNKTISGGTYIEFKQATDWINVEKVLGTVSSALESSIKIGDTSWYLYLADLNGDGKYDKLAITPVKDLSKAYAILSEGEWSKPINTTIVYANKTYTIAPLFKALRLNPIDDFRLYRGLTRPLEAPWFNNETVARDIWNNVVVKTGTFTDGDYTGLSRGWYDEETYMETVYFTNLFFMEFTIYMIKNYDWDLIMSYTPVVDNVYHQFLGLTDPTTPYYNPEKASYYWSLIERTYKMIDEFVGNILNNVDLSNTVVMLISDHGQYPVKKVVYVNGILLNNGFISVDTAFRVNLTGTLAYVTYHGHIFVNLIGRETNGTVSPTDYDNVVKSIMEILRSYRDPDTGEHVFDLVITRDESKIIGLSGIRTGDIVFALKPGYTSSTALRQDPATGKAIEIETIKPYVSSTGDHGPVLPYYRELKAVFVSTGPGVKGGYLGEASVLQIAPTIAKILNINPPRDAKMPPIFSIYEITATKTLTQATTITQLLTQYSTVTQTRTSTLTQITTSSLTYISTKTEISTSIVRELDIATTSIIAIILLIVGILVGYFVFRKTK
ncbi:MAG: alkaline phosphatase family protein [Desulfurococcaceae archaeon]